MKDLTGISESDLAKLRNAGLIDEDEIAYVYAPGTMLLVENVKTRARRLLNASAVELDANKQLLKG